MQNMTCPRCNAQMEMGSLVGNGMNWISTAGKVSWWANVTATFNFGKTPAVVAWKCPSCGKVELEAPTNN